MVICNQEKTCPSQSIHEDVFCALCFFAIVLKAFLYLQIFGDVGMTDRNAKARRRLSGLELTTAQLLNSRAGRSFEKYVL